MKKILGILVLLTQFQTGFLYASENKATENGKTDVSHVCGIGHDPIFYPNPVKDILYLKKSAAYIIKNSAGLVVKQGFGASIPVGDLPTGTYILEVKGKSNTFVKE